MTSNTFNGIVLEAAHYCTKYSQKGKYITRQERDVVIATLKLLGVRHWDNGYYDRIICSANALLQSENSSPRIIPHNIITFLHYKGVTL